MKKERVIIFVLVGVMIFSAVATGLLFLAQSDRGANGEQAAQSEMNEQQVCQASTAVAAQPGQPEGEWPTASDTPVESLQTINLREGNGQAAELGDCITVHYRLSLADGTPIEGNDTFEAGTPIAFELAEGALIEGWVQGIPGLREGGFRRLMVPAELAYGETERSGIPAGSDLIFDVELVKIEF